MEKEKTTDKILTHMLDRLTDNEIATSDIKEMLIKLNATIQEVVEVLDVVVDPDLNDNQAYSEIKKIKDKNILTEYVISEYFRTNPKEAEEMLEDLLEKKVLFTREIGES